uniref:Formamidopyrimidine-DNA glycosylase catalytic domain-containing protein n=1 Tax=Gopherus agassizii TaxID=38772 RepID=A0A452GGM9_9SAUR
MPEGPELHLAICYINTVCAGLIFSGKVEKSEVSRNPEVLFESNAYLISATSRGKEIKTRSLAEGETRSQNGLQQPMDLVFRFGMSGSFKLTSVAELSIHAHLRFYTKESPHPALCFMDFRRFRRWEVHGTWQENVLRNLSDKAFNKPICEALLNQKFFNGIGDYLRAEILYRLKIPPFEKARTVLEALQHRKQSPDLSLSKKVKLKRENPDLLELCHAVPVEVIHMGKEAAQGAQPRVPALQQAMEPAGGGDSWLAKSTRLTQLGVVYMLEAVSKPGMSALTVKQCKRQPMLREDSCPTVQIVPWLGESEPVQRTSQEPGLTHMQPTLKLYGQSFNIPVPFAFPVSSPARKVHTVAPPACAPPAGNLKGPGAPGHCYCSSGLGPFKSSPEPWVVGVRQHRWAGWGRLPLPAPPLPPEALPLLGLPPVLVRIYYYFYP